MGDVAALGRIGTKALGLYVATTALAITVALLIAGVVSPGVGFDITGVEIDFKARAAPPLSQVLIDLVPSNPVAALANGEMLQIIVFALLLGVAITIASTSGYLMGCSHFCAPFVFWNLRPKSAHPRAGCCLSYHRANTEIEISTGVRKSDMDFYCSMCLSPMIANEHVFFLDRA